VSHKPLQPAAYPVNEQRIVNAKQKRTLPPSLTVGFQVKLKKVPSLHTYQQWSLASYTLDWPANRDEKHPEAMHHRIVHVKAL